jgi:hypothetical protein
MVCKANFAPNLELRCPAAGNERLRAKEPTLRI